MQNFNPETREILYNQIIEKNLSKMTTEMRSLLAGESIGGTGGRAEYKGKKYNGTAANGILNIKTGEIIKFGNHEKAQGDLRRFTILMLVVINMTDPIRYAEPKDKKSVYHIQKFFVWNDTEENPSFKPTDISEQLDPQVKEVLDKSIEEYNKNYFIEPD
jgi:hypothetical protein